MSLVRCKSLLASVAVLTLASLLTSGATVWLHAEQDDFACQPQDRDATDTVDRLDGVERGARTGAEHCGVCHWARALRFGDERTSSHDLRLDAAGTSLLSQACPAGRAAASEIPARAPPA